MNNAETKVGIEIETSKHDEGLVRATFAAGLIAHGHKCGYHCGRSCCAHDEHRPNILTAQEDCSVASEFITRPIRLGNAGAWSQLQTFGGILAEHRAEADPMSNTGCHVHVDAAVLDALPTRNVRNERVDGREQLAQFFFPLQDSLEIFAGGALSSVRDYNQRITQSSSYRTRTQWLNLRRGTETVEFRLWNGSTSPWRWRMYAGISAGMVAAVADGKRIDGRRRVPTLTKALRGYLDDETLDLMGRQAIHNLKLHPKNPDGSFAEPVAEPEPARNEDWLW